MIKTKVLCIRLSTMVFCAVLLGSVFQVACAEPIVRIDSGQLAGRSDGGVDIYLGIPYAASPTGINRWRAPQPVAPWEGIREATDFCASCPQPIPNGDSGSMTSGFMIPGPIDEDCLFLNIWTPNSASESKCPVMLWIHGGGFMSGSGSKPIFEGGQFAKQGIVVVTVNYRLGALGFLAAPALGPQPGNYAILDLIAALQWIKRNISVFGGDPNNITIAGQSAGSVAVHALVASPTAKGLFVRAIAQSGSGVLQIAQPLNSAKAIGAQYILSKGVSTLDELRALPASAFVMSNSAVNEGPASNMPTSLQKKYLLKSLLLALIFLTFSAGLFV